VRFRDEISKEFGLARTEQDRVVLLALHEAIVDALEEALLQSAELPPDELEKFRTLRLQAYHSLIVRESVDKDWLIQPELLANVTKREVDAGRMAPDDELRVLATNNPPHEKTKSKGGGLWARILGR
jgi:hypothetical protein